MSDIIDDDVRILRREQVVELTGLSLRQLVRLEALGHFPASRRLGVAGGNERACGYIKADVLEWIRNRPLAADVKPPPTNGGQRKAKKTKKRIRRTQKRSRRK